MATERTELFEGGSAAQEDRVFTDWRPNNPDSSERFRLGRSVWWVDAAKRILTDAPRLSRSLRVADWLGLANLLDTKASSGAIDLEVPVICVRLGRSYLPIDGWTRIRRALVTGTVTLPCVCLTAAESKQVGV